MTAVVPGTLRPHTPQTSPDSKEEFESSRAGGAFGFPGGRLCRGSAALGDVEGGAPPPEPLWTAPRWAGEGHGSSDEAEGSWSLGDLRNRVLLAQVLASEAVGYCRMETGTPLPIGPSHVPCCGQLFGPVVFLLRMDTDYRGAAARTSPRPSTHFFGVIFRLQLFRQSFPCGPLPPRSWAVPTWARQIRQEPRSLADSQSLCVCSEKPMFLPRHSYSLLGTLGSLQGAEFLPGSCQTSPVADIAAVVL